MKEIRLELCAEALSRRLPKMMVFDYGGTLGQEVAFDPVRGSEALLAHAVRNDRGLTGAEVAAVADRLFVELLETRLDTCLEVHEHHYQRYLYESQGISFSLTPFEMENIFWDGFSPALTVPGAAELLARLRALGIRTGVISNIMFSGEALARRLKILLPEHDFEFIVASSDYVFRKPHRRIFELALTKADLPSGDVWYLGNSFPADVLGAAGAGMFPVWYTGVGSGESRDADTSGGPEMPYLRIDDWNMLTAALPGTTI